VLNPDGGVTCTHLTHFLQNNSSLNLITIDTNAGGGDRKKRMGLVDQRSDARWLPLHLSQVRAALPRLIEDDNPLLSGFGRQLLAALYEELYALEQRIEKIEEQVQQIHRSNALCQKIAAVEGIGPVTATAVVAAIADGRTFHNGRQFAAWIGLVPRQHSSGDKQRHFGITKRGDPYLRMLLVHGARSVVYRAPNKNDSRSQWIAEKQRKLGTAKTCVAVANKNARVIWALLARDEPYRRAS
jgi:transposase